MKLINQLIKFGLIGAIATIIDYGLLIFFTEVLNISSLVSAAMSFTISVIFNYFASIKWVFNVDKEKNSKFKQIIIFIILSSIGLFINEFIMWILEKEFSMHYTITKLLATIVVMVWNFITRKIFLENNINS